MNYDAFLSGKARGAPLEGFEPLWLPDFLFPFQVALVEWALRKGRAAIFADCGLGKTPMQLVWAENVVRKTNRPVLILTPLAVGLQTMAEGAKFGVECERSRDGCFSGRGITITNYEKLHLFDPKRFSGVVCDESSILKHFNGATQKAVTAFMNHTPYRLLCTATAAPNDYVELGTSSEALGGLGQIEMLSSFFKKDDKIHVLNERMRRQKMAMRGEHAESRTVVAGTGASWRLKGHATTPFWRWICSWARACRQPKDLGFEDDRFILPQLQERQHVIETRYLREGMLFPTPAIGLSEERVERRGSLKDRCEFVSELVNHERSAVVWCHLNDEGDMLERAISGSVQVKGADRDEAKEEAYRAFSSGEVRVLVTKPKIGAWGLNWAHCDHVVTFASHSYEQFYQSVRRCWRFGQKNKVTVDIVSTEAERYVQENMIRKAKAADRMFKSLVAHMNESEHASIENEYVHPVEAPAWL